VAREVLKSLMRRNPAVFNPLWALAYPMVRRDERYAGHEYVDRGEAFDTIYRQNRWGSGESRSGKGSTLHYTRPLRASLARCLDRLKVGVLLDAPCGDFNWMRHVELPSGARYVGGDIVAPLIEELREKSGDATHEFCRMDIVEEPLPHADLWLCRDVLFHLSNAEILKVLRNFCHSSIPHMLTTTYHFQKFNSDIKSGGFRFINLRLPPFVLPKPISVIEDFVAPEPPRYLGLWSRAQIRTALGEAGSK
jgi:hypothetical protein